MIIIGNTNQMPTDRKYLYLNHTDPVEAVKELESLAEQEGVKIVEIYNWGKTYYYAVVEAK